MDSAVRRIAPPALLFIRWQADAVTGTAVACDRTLRKAFDLHAMQFLAGLQVANLETEQVVHVDIAQRFSRIDRERPDRRAEWTNLADRFLGLYVNDGQRRRL